MGLIQWLRDRLGAEEAVLLDVPIGDIKGGLYVSPMPFGPYDTRNQLMKRYQREHIEFAVPLVTDEEIRAKAKRDLMDLYRQAGIEVIRFPIADLTSPELEKVRELVRQIAPRIKAGAKVAVHCNAGVGRSAVITACLMCALLEIPGSQAIARIQELMTTQLTSSQKRVVEQYQDNPPPL
jgi:protein-tyrosine phosphatase